MCVFLNSCDVNLSMCIPTYNMWHFLVIEILFLFTWNVCWLKVKQKKEKFFSSFQWQIEFTQNLCIHHRAKMKNSINFFFPFSLTCSVSHRMSSILFTINDDGGWHIVNYMWSSSSTYTLHCSMYGDFFFNYTFFDLFLKHF